MSRARARVLITGAAGGIGAAAKSALEKAGATVVGLDLEAVGDDVLACDVRDQASVEAAVAEAVERLGGLDVVVNNAGVGHPQSAGTPPDGDALAVIDTNLLGPWRVTAAALPALLESRGRVVNVASGLSFLAVPFAPAYAASKRGLVAYSDALRGEYAGALTVTTVYPGYIRTPIHAAAVAAGITLEGMVPAETVHDAARTIVRAALGPPVRDLATTRGLGFGYWLLRVMPRGVADRVVRRSLGRQVRAGALDGSPLAQDYVRRVLGSRPGKAR